MSSKPHKTRTELFKKLEQFATNNPNSKVQDAIELLGTFCV
jgi:hypothetical protein